LSIEPSEYRAVNLCNVVQRKLGNSFAQVGYVTTYETLHARNFGIQMDKNSQYKCKNDVRKGNVIGDVIAHLKQ